MVWTRELFDVRTFNPPAYLSDDTRILSTQSCITYKLKAKRTGILKISNTAAYANRNIYVSFTNSFNTSTGEPDDYFATGLGSVSINATKNTIYFITFKGSADSSVTFTMIMEYTAVNYDSLLYPIINNEEDFNSTIYNYSKFNNSTYTTCIIPVTFKSVGKCRITQRIGVAISGTTMRDAAVNTSLESVDINTGKPTTDISTHIVLTPEYWEFDTVANTTYYIYLILDDSARTLFTFKFEWLPNTITPVPYSNIHLSSIDQFGRTQGYFYYNNYNNSIHTYSNAYLYGNIKILWYTSSSDTNLVYDGHTYKWAKFMGWYDNPNFEGEPISYNPYIENLEVNTTSIYLYAYLELTDDDIEWEYPVVSGQQFNISAYDWNNLVIYAAEKGADLYSVNYYEKSGSRPSASIFSDVKSAIDDVATTILPPTSRIQSGDAIYASYYNNILNEARSIT